MIVVHRGIRAALVGYGYSGSTFHAPLIAATPGIELSVVVSSDPAKVHADMPAARVCEGLDQALADPDIDLVVIATPDPLHAPQAHATLDAGKHVVIDKPFALTLEDARSLVEHSGQAGRILSVFHNRRWDSDFLTLKSLVGSGRLGEIVQFESHFDRFRPEVRDRWRERPGAGILNDLGPHLIDQALALFGMPVAVYADLGIQKHEGLADDYFHILLRYPRLRAFLHASQLTLDNSLRLAVHGTSGSFIKRGMDPQEEQLKAGGNPSDPEFGLDREPCTLLELAKPEQGGMPVAAIPGDYRQFYAGIRDAIVMAGPSPVSAEEALNVMRVMAAAKQSHLGRHEVSIGGV
jgi:predicted dehydrogenase